MIRLRDRPADLLALVSRTAEATRIPAAFVEKDFWVVELLRSVSAPVDGAFAVFKGGTSLSKAYGVIERFSEDVDILLVTGGLSERQRDTAMKAICERVEREVGMTAGEAFSKRGVARNVRYAYGSGYADGRISEGVLLEMGIRGNPDPHDQRELRSYVADHAINALGIEASQYEEFKSVRVRVLGRERTLVEKLSVVHHLGTLENERIAISDKGRHLYDIHRLLGDKATIEAIAGTAYVEAAARDAAEHSAANGWDYTPRPDGGFAASPVFEPGGPKAQGLHAAYERARPLVYGEFPSLAEVFERVKAHANSL